jgi:hypothetical protein
MQAIASSFLRLPDHNDAPQSVGLLWTSDKSDAETSTWQHTTLTTVTFMPPGGIRIKKPSKRAAVDPRLKPRGHWDRHSPNYSIKLLYSNFQDYALLKSPTTKFQHVYAEKKCLKISDEAKYNNFMFAFRPMRINRQNWLLVLSFLPSVCRSVRLPVSARFPLDEF